MHFAPPPPPHFIRRCISELLLILTDALFCVTRPIDAIFRATLASLRGMLILPEKFDPNERDQGFSNGLIGIPPDTIVNFPRLSRGLR